MSSHHPEARVGGVMRTELGVLAGIKPPIEPRAEGRKTWRGGALSMSLLFQPGPGTLLICDFTSFKEPEMTKKRPVVVVSPRRRRAKAKLCIVVPLSTAVPNPVERFHHRMDPRSVPVELGAQESWAKCDMLYTVSLERLDRVSVNKGGRRIFVAPRVLEADLNAIRQGVMSALGLDAA